MNIELKEFEEENNPHMRIVEKNFESFTRPQQIKHLEVEGYLVIPKVLNQRQINDLKIGMSDAEMLHTDYSTKQTRSVKQPQWHSRAVAEIIGHPVIIDFLNDLMGPEIVFTRGFYQKSLSGCPGISLHTDGQPHGSNILVTRGVVLGY